jgi:hypothetical protein
MKYLMACFEIFGLSRALGRRLGMTDPCISDSDLKSLSMKNNEQPCIDCPCILPCVSTAASYLHSEALHCIYRPRVGILLNDEAAGDVAACAGSEFSIPDPLCLADHS